MLGLFMGHGCIHPRAKSVLDTDIIFKPRLLPSFKLVASSTWGVRPFQVVLFFMEKRR
ncbi:molybdopterin molybdotransferase [Ardenticatena maritima]|uniref:Molybdopterin molybdotransferase n=1 Tax=Ardenticatena maritima TaxID=872965 RepID=A0A0M8K9N9_9CHLR|nr:molybdopterin molybdotransferase [Ardenticatena maritima]